MGGEGGALDGGQALSMSGRVKLDIFGKGSACSPPPWQHRGVLLGAQAAPAAPVRSILPSAPRGRPQQQFCEPFFVAHSVCETSMASCVVIKLTLSTHQPMQHLCPAMPPTVCRRGKIGCCTLWQQAEATAHRHHHYHDLCPDPS